MIVAVGLGATLLCAWIVLVDAKAPATDRRLTNVALSPSGRWLAAGNAPGKITIWDQTHREPPKRIAFPHGELNDLQFSPEESVLAIAAADLGMYKLKGSAGPRLLRSDHENYGSARFRPDGQSLLVVTGSGRIETIDVRSGAVQVQACCSSVYGEAAYTPDGQTIVNAGHWPGIWDARSGQLIARLTTEREFSTFRPIAFDAGRDAVLMGSQDGRVYGWDLKTRRPLAASPPQSGYVDTLAVSADGWVVFAAFGQAVQVWDPASGRRWVLPGSRPTSNVVLGVDGRSIVFGTAEGVVAFRDLR